MYNITQNPYRRFLNILECSGIPKPSKALLWRGFVEKQKKRRRTRKQPAGALEEKKNPSQTGRAKGLCLQAAR
jgi:hypothetical protein